MKNRARITPLTGGTSLLTLEVHTKITEERRLALFMNLALDSLIDLEALLGEMPDEKVEMLHAEVIANAKERPLDDLPIGMPIQLQDPPP